MTAGPTYEPLDEVRRLTNFSTGRLGTLLAVALSEAGHNVVLLRGTLSTFPLQVPPNLECESFTTTDDLAARLHKRAGPNVGSLFHAAAVSDFAFGKLVHRTEDGSFAEIQQRKVATRDGSLWAELRPTRKILPQLRDWFPSAGIIGWKYEADGGSAQAKARGAAQIRECRTDACVVNGPAYGGGFGILQRAGGAVHCADATELCSGLLSWLSRR